MSSRNVRCRPIAWRIAQDRRINALGDPWAMLAFTWLIPCADNLGRVEGDPELVAAMIFPRQREAMTPERTAKILQTLHDGGLLFGYTVDGERFLTFSPESWGRHQKLVGNMRAESDFPAPNEAELAEWLNHTRSVPVETGSYEYVPVPPEEKRREVEEKVKVREGKDPSSALPEREPDQVKCKPSYEPDSMPFHLAARLRELILQNRPTAKVPSLESARFVVWCDQVRLMVERDHRDVDEIARIIEWCQRDSFWLTNILSTGKLREQFDQLALKMPRQQANGQAPSQVPTARSAAPERKMWQHGD